MLEFGSLAALKALAAIAVFCVSVLLGSLFAAIWLQLAARLLGFGKIDYRTAFKCALLTNFVMAVLNFSIGFNFGLSNQLLSENPDAPRNFAFALSPTYFLYTLVLNLVMTAGVFRRLLTCDDDTSTTPFTDLLALASVYYSLALGALTIVSLAVYLLITGILIWLGG